MRENVEDSVANLMWLPIEKPDTNNDYSRALSRCVIHVNYVIPYCFQLGLCVISHERDLQRGYFDGLKQLSSTTSLLKEVEEKVPTLHA